jgi:isochorismate hydrolase
MGTFTPLLHLREAFDLTKALLLVIDLQNYCSHPQGGQHKNDRADNEETRYYWKQLNTVVPNVKHLQEACRDKGIEVLFTVRAKIRMQLDTVHLDVARRAKRLGV